MNIELTLTEKALDGTFKRRVARKEWRCRTTQERRRGWDGGPLPAGHTDIISAGDLHIEYLGESSAYQSGVRYCAACAHAAGLALYSLGTMPEETQ